MERQELLMRYLDRKVSPTELREVESWLREDATARAWLREIAEQAIMMSDLGRAQALRRAAPDAPHHSRPSRLPWIALAATTAIILVLSALLLAKSGTTPEIVQVEEVTGGLSWTGVNGELRTGLNPGQRLPAGTFETDSESAHAVLRFIDGTKLSLGAGVQVAIADEGQKRVHLMAGTLNADVRPQPRSHPMLVRTSTATLEVIGTLFSVAAGPEQTSMNVEHGQVRVQRLADGAIVDVPAHHAVLASLEVGHPLRTQVSVMPPAIWRTDFTRPPTAGWLGVWNPASGPEPALFTAIPLVAGRKPDGSLVLHYGVAMTGAKSLPTGSTFLTATPQSVVHLRYRMAKPHALLLFCTTHGPAGGFVGNFEFHLPADAGAVDAEGWRHLDIPLANFEPLRPVRSTHVAGFALSHFSVKTFSPDAVLQVAGLSIDDAPTSASP